MKHLCLNIPGLCSGFQWSSLGEIPSRTGRGVGVVFLNTLCGEIFLQPKESAGYDSSLEGLKLILCGMVEATREFSNSPVESPHIRQDKVTTLDTSCWLWWTFVGASPYLPPSFSHWGTLIFSFEDCTILHSLPYSVGGINPPPAPGMGPDWSKPVREASNHLHMWLVQKRTRGLVLANGRGWS